MAHNFTPRFHSSFSFAVTCENFLIAPRLSQPILRFLPINTTFSGSASSTRSSARCNSSEGCFNFSLSISLIFNNKQSPTQPTSPTSPTLKKKSEAAAASLSPLPSLSVCYPKTIYLHRAIHYITAAFVSQAMLFLPAPSIEPENLNATGLVPVSSHCKVA